MDDRQLRDLVGVVVEHIPDLIVIVDQTGVVRWANTRAEAVLSTTVDQWLLRPVLDIIHPDDLPLGLELLVSARASGSGVKEPVTFRARNGDEWVTLEVVASNVDLPGGELASLYIDSFERVWDTATPVDGS
jgi:PAS domain-containing protein